jgi:hypothetical protein
MTATQYPGCIQELYQSDSLGVVIEQLQFPLPAPEAS